MANILKKDLNKPSPYNGGVVLCRIAIFFLAAALAAVCWRLSYSPPELKGLGVQEIKVTEMSTRIQTTYARRYRFHRYYYLKAVNEETGHEYSQTITADEYKRLREGETYYENVFETTDGYFISWDNISDEKEATRLYYRRFPNAEIVSRSIVIGIFLFLTALNGIIGLILIRSGNKRFISSRTIKQPASFEEMLDSNDR